MKTTAGTTVSGAMYLGPCWERTQLRDGSFAVLKLWMYLERGERRFAESEQAARAAVDAVNAARVA